MVHEEPTVTQIQDAAALARNRLLRVMSPEALARIREAGEVLTFEPGAELEHENTPFRHVYFPLDCIISVISPMGELGVETGTIGNEGFSGLPVLFGAEQMPLRVIIEVPGTLVRLPAGAFRAMVDSDLALHQLLDRYAMFFLVQVGQSVACNRLHEIERRCARWLLMTHDRVGGDQFALKQEFLAQMLGVRRAGVSEAASALAKAGMIRYSRGTITVVDREGLERAACECYATVRRELDRLPQ